MNTKSLCAVTIFASLIISLTLFDLGCKKDESPTSPGGGGTLPTFSFATAGQTFTVPLSGGAARARLTGGTLPFIIMGPPSPSIAVASLNHDTLTVIPVAAGSTSITIGDSLAASFDRIVTLGITVTSGSGSNYGSGTVTATSSAGNLSITGIGVWPPQVGPSVIAMHDTSVRAFFVYGYQRVSGPNYNIVAIAALLPSGFVAATYTQIAVGVAFNVDTTSRADSLVYQSVSGSVTVSSVSGSNAVGTYSVMARKGSAQPIQFTGTFNVAYAVGVMPDWSERRVVSWSSSRAY